VEAHVAAIVEYFPITKVGTDDDPEQTFQMPTTVIVDGQRADAVKLSQQMLAMVFSDTVATVVEVQDEIGT